ncbi:MAG: hypothetical protein OER22_04145 [Gammaproteobacteria bacterium]|nr:hypothetical protein [Gammaproteobacteria bacterium]MDH3373269.1 hypothetical protein [Gammaproteobacteria bacterium]MDH3410085.1 hypothetical protein [Gammaproteobacteria bacterium]MDH3551788.1 hypothetical protein [Gammaproteobacteria bacterium]
MRPLFDEFDELDFDFADNAAVERAIREQRREERRLGRRRSFGHKNVRVDEFSDYDDFTDLDDYSDYDDDEFDSYSRMELDD